VTLTFPQDTPINRASIEQLNEEQLKQLVTTMRERRMRSYSVYQDAQAAKARLQHDKDCARYEHVLEMFEKKLKTVDTGLEALSKYCNELVVLRITIGERE
jgi:phosphopentomutase